MVASDPENAFDTFDQTPAKSSPLFSSSIFALESGRTERFQWLRFILWMISQIFLKVALNQMHRLFI